MSARKAVPRRGPPAGWGWLRSRARAASARPSRGSAPAGSPPRTSRELPAPPPPPPPPPKMGEGTSRRQAGAASRPAQPVAAQQLPLVRSHRRRRSCHRRRRRSCRRRRRRSCRRRHLRRSWRSRRSALAVPAAAVAAGAGRGAGSTGRFPSQARAVECGGRPRPAACTRESAKVGERRNLSFCKQPCLVDSPALH